MSRLDLVPFELLTDYCNILLSMAVFRNRDEKMYAELDLKRIQAHDRILKIAGTTREDEKFAFELAKFVEETLF